jgi:hypothetical protein
MEIDDKYIDVDFTKDPRYTFGDRGAFHFGDYPVYEDAVPVLSTAEINAAIEESQGSTADFLVSRIYDQKNEGSCVANACCQAHEISQARQYGLNNVIHLSAMSLYKRISRGAQAGAVVSDGLEELKQRGALPLDNPENRTKFGSAVMPNTGWNTPFPADWERVANMFCGVEYHVVKTPNGLMTALCNRHPVIVGREGHSLAYVRPMNVQGRWAAGYVNSWSENWGMGMGSFQSGFGIDTMSQVAKSAQYAFVLRSVDTPEDA